MQYIEKGRELQVAQFYSLLALWNSLMPLHGCPIHHHGAMPLSVTVLGLCRRHTGLRGETRLNERVPLRCSAEFHREIYQPLLDRLVALAQPGPARMFVRRSSKVDGKVHPGK